MIRSLLILLAFGMLQNISFGFKDEIGHTLLSERLGNDLPEGDGISIAQIEAPAAGDYAPDTANPEFAGKSISLQSGSSGDSTHATVVGQFAYGTNTGIAPLMNEVEVWEANNWLSSGFLRVNTILSPRTESQDIQNHSWIGSLGSLAQDQQALRRLDLLVNRDEVQVFAGVNNGSSNPIPNLMASAYNVTSVGVSSGEHSSGSTSADGAGRQKPDIVAPPGVVSNSTPVLSGAAALLLEAAKGSTALANAENNEVIKAILMAGATKSEFPNWIHSDSNPLDSTFGVGELNIFNSYFLLTGGEQEFSDSTPVPTTGWHFGRTHSVNPRRYYFEVPQGPPLRNYSVVLTWNREISGLNSDLQSSLENLDLRLFAASAMSPTGEALHESMSSLDNVEHLFVAELPAGEYVLEVDSNGGVVDYGLAWQGLRPVANPEVVSTVVDLDQQTITLQLKEPHSTISSYFLVETSADLGAAADWIEVPVIQAGANGAGIYQLTFKLSSNPRQFWRVHTVSP